MDNFLNDNVIKLIALDMDGTLFTDDHRISDGNRKAIKEAQERGIYVVLSTGRRAGPHRRRAGLPGADGRPAAAGQGRRQGQEDRARRRLGV
ncbi:MAG: HAD hydrolase family protein, partial [Neobacillus sp.]